VKIFPRTGDWLSLLLRWAILLFMSILSFIFFTNMPGSSYPGPLRPLSTCEQEVSVNLKQQIFMLAEKIGERNIYKHSNLKASAYYIEKAMTELGYKVHKQEYMVKDLPAENLESELVGVHHPEEIILVGAHYDSVIGSPGANDNASGVAAVLEIARLLKTETLSRTVRFVTFVNEEPPFFQTDKMGSRVYASRSRQRGEKIIAMLSLETIGYYSNEKGSQKYPFPFRFFYPATGNFIGFVGNVSSRALVREAIKAFRRNTAFPSEGIAAPSWIMRTDWSDNWSFCKEGYQAIMITDTALFRYQYYHSEQDLPDKIDYERMARVVVGITQIIRNLSTAK
jgi:Peptidase family M28